MSYSIMYKIHFRVALRPVIGKSPITEVTNFQLMQTQSNTKLQYKLLAQILSRYFVFYDIATKHKRYFKAITLTLALAFIQIPNPTLIPTLCLTQADENQILFLLASHLTEAAFFPITPQGSVFTLRDVGWFGISEQKYVYFHLCPGRILRTC